jgi:acyl-CoA thioesterase I
MLNHFLYHLASGQAWFSCGLLFLLVTVLDVRGAFEQRRRLGRVAWLLLWLAMLLAAASTTPVPLWLAIPLVASCLAYMVFGFSHQVRIRRLVLGSGASSLILVALILELPFHFPGPQNGARSQGLYVVADSLAAGLGREQTTWPKLLAARIGSDVRDRSFPGANTRSALRTLTKVLGPADNPHAWVLVCIGGNDMLGKTSAEDFANDLDQLLAVARGNPPHRRTVLMQELPLIPGAWAFGTIQRRLAAKHGVVLIPKRLLAGVVLTEENVVDGLHLSAAGHERMAELLLPWVDVH